MAHKPKNAIMPTETKGIQLHWLCAPFMCARACVCVCVCVCMCVCCRWMGYSGLVPSKLPHAPAENWMSMAEYLAMCRELGSRPLIGVNYNCHNMKNCKRPLNESLASAARLVRFVVARGFEGAFYYIGNEECQETCVGAHADLIAQHAKVMKAIDPTIKTLWNCNEIKAPGLSGFMEQASTRSTPRFPRRTHAHTQLPPPLPRRHTFIAASSPAGTGGPWRMT